METIGTICGLIENNHLRGITARERAVRLSFDIESARLDGYNLNKELNGTGIDQGKSAIKCHQEPSNSRAVNDYQADRMSLWVCLFEDKHASKGHPPVHMIADMAQCCARIVILHPIRAGWKLYNCAK